MKNNPLDELAPTHEQEGWRALVGHRRYRHSPAAAENADWVTAFLRGAGLDLISGDPRLLEFKAMRFSTFLISHLRTPAIHVRWSRARVTAQSRYLLIFANHGSVSIDGEADRWVSAGGGLGVVFPGDEPVDLQISEQSEAVLFAFDRDEIAPHILTPTNIGDIRPGTSVFRAAYAYLQAAVDVPRIADQPDEATEVLRTLTREVARALMKAAITEHRSSDTFLRAQRTIDEHSVDPEFDVDALAAHCNVSRRTLDRLYEHQGLRPAQEIRRSRAQRAFPLLTASTSLTLDEVVAASGFRSVTTMNRALLAVYGVSASAARRPGAGTSG
ncbi:helix-turn-helix domain-containing protein [Microbacterium esteraromaticum]|uniref:AraC family transcriptional regulator n=1 Tax=Microbacterium esteraromaticum TaxID=57043 RepID=UPI0023686B85|nr:AraC family transcriptional regulator [Microbacterium esteraromaticum]WDH78693.1 helix-turn-helix domain-containing protein [Microbacterium esteraromaticum]